MTDILTNLGRYFNSLTIEEFDELLDEYGFEYENIDSKENAKES